MLTSWHFPLEMQVTLNSLQMTELVRNEFEFFRSGFELKLLNCWHKLSCKKIVYVSV